MLSYVKNYFRNCRLARMSNGEYCLIRDQGLVKGGRGLKCHKTLMVFSIRGVAAKFRPSPTASGTGERNSLLGDGSRLLDDASGGLAVGWHAQNRVWVRSP